MAIISAKYVGVIYIGIILAVGLFFVGKGDNWAVYVQALACFTSVFVLEMLVRAQLKAIFYGVLVSLVMLTSSTANLVSMVAPSLCLLAVGAAGLYLKWQQRLSDATPPP